jgi:hypothetical protein
MAPLDGRRRLGRLGLMQSREWVREMSLEPHVIAALCVTKLQKEFTEPVALSSTRPADLPLPRTAVGLSFDLLALRARCVEEPMVEKRLRQAASTSNSRSLRSFWFSRVSVAVVTAKGAHGPEAAANGSQVRLA